jgi:hypothetical protein
MRRRRAQTGWASLGRGGKAIILLEGGLGVGGREGGGGGREKREREREREDAQRGQAKGREGRRV